MPRSIDMALERKQSIGSLQQQYKAEKLRFLVGAGVSIECGFPNWDELSRGLLSEHFRRNHSNAAIGLADRMLDSLGKEGAAEFVLQATDRDQFIETVATALYRGRCVEDLELSPLHHQLASMKVENGCYFTTNFDPLLELALAHNDFARLGKIQDWISYRRPEGGAYRQQSSWTLRTVKHVHGWIERRRDANDLPQINHAEPIVLAESQYLEHGAHRDAPANRELIPLLEREGATLILGMSLADPNLRRILYFINKDKNHHAPGNMYAIVREDDTDVQQCAYKHWSNKGVKLLFVDEYRDVSGMLRSIKYPSAAANEPPSWVTHSIKHLTENGYFDHFDSARGESILKEAHDRLRTLFAIPEHEQIQLCFYVPDKENPELWPACVFSPRLAGSAIKSTSWRSFRISSEAPQGVVGIAYITGTERQIIDDTLHHDPSLLPELVDYRTRNWRSILALPILGSGDNLPLAVIAVTSNCVKPFFTRFGARSQVYDAQFRAELIEAGRVMLSTE